MLLAQQPSNMREEKSPVRIVWIRIGLAELVVNSVVAAPLENAVLQRNNRVEISYSHKKGAAAIQSTPRPAPRRPLAPSGGVRVKSITVVKQ